MPLSLHFALVESDAKRQPSTLRRPVTQTWYSNWTAESWVISSPVVAHTTEEIALFSMIEQLSTRRSFLFRTKHDKRSTTLATVCAGEVLLVPAVVSLVHACLLPLVQTF